MKGGKFSNVLSLIRMVFIGVRHPDLLIVRNFLFLDRQLSIKKRKTLFHYFLCDRKLNGFYKMYLHLGNLISKYGAYSLNIITIYSKLT